MAQKKELSQARSYIKSGKYDDADKLMTGLLQDSVNRYNMKVYLTLYDAVRGKFNQGNEKFYLKQQQDTAAFFGHVIRMFTILETIDTLDLRPDKKGKVNPQYRNRHASQMDVCRPNLFNGGTYHVSKGNWKEAFRFFETYIDCGRQPLFSNFLYDSLDTRMPEAGYWATYCGFKLHDPVMTLRHRKLALRDSARACFTLQYMAEARQWLNDQEQYLTTLQEGFRRYPQFPYFFPRLMDEYTKRGDYEKALGIADSALAVNDSSELFLFAKSTTLLRLDRYEESIQYSERLLKLNPQLSEPYFNAGMAYVNMASRLDERRDISKIKELYQKARPYMEEYRKLMPSEKEKWAPVLYRVYLNLNMGKQFDEIDRLLKK